MSDTLSLAYTLRLGLLCRVWAHQPVRESSLPGSLPRSAARGGGAH